MPSGIIVKGIGGFYYVETPQGLYECKARGIFRRNKVTPLPGDRVEISIIDNETKKGSIEEIGQINSELERPAIANVDQAIIVIAARSPQPDLMLMDKLLITTELKGINPIICINKIDTDEGMEHKKVTEAYSKTGYPLILTSFKSELGYEELKKRLYGKITVFAGQSGVGKSTILNKLMNSQVMETGELSERIERGKNTTRHAELIKHENDGYIADTPGFSSFELKDLYYEELHLYYPEFQDFLNSCRFTRCSHVSEPGCGVKKALEQGEIDKGRYGRYVQIYNFLKTENANRYR